MIKYCSISHTCLLLNDPPPPLSHPPTPFFFFFLFKSLSLILQDCGGTCPLLCGYQKGCSVDFDCGYDLFCIEQMCQYPPESCDDGIQNGTETDVVSSHGQLSK
jgi:hypothetical protein